ncbi:MoxR family ATPase [Haloarcula sp. 1CSR25-25]|uniref:AAA family ATPase n=1 Tax=Haloarcula sp. 1CSR25-25 TaxID=2862545 RepID=UPI0028947184|nr:MoxR family ATPase [Haloarcula sp. 1CSR25-25]MDT3435456.1 MoxR family ATPase [Haloarcula sp. 1CSR25-25]
MTDPSVLYDRLKEEADTVLIGNEEVLRHITIAILTRGHVLLEGVPGVAKTTIATLVANATNLEHSRIQMTPDLLPADITGTTVYHQQNGEFELQKGPVFTNLVVADEINRAPPKTQSALLEAMQEGQVSIEGSTLELPTPFTVVATMNPLEMEGTFKLPEAQRDRFQMKLVAEIPDTNEERAILDRFDANPTLDADAISQVLSRDELLNARTVIPETHIEDSVKEYILSIVDATRDHRNVTHGASPRATIALQNTAKAAARLNGREYVIPDDVKEMALPVLRHRLIMNSDAELSQISSEAVIEEILQSITPPGSDTDHSAGVEPAVGDGGTKREFE